jgi:UDP-glucose 4-epimerase
MKVLVTGGNGFIGRHVCRALRRRGATPITFDRTKNADFLGDVRDRGSVFEAVYNVDGVIHLAAVLGTQETFNRTSEVAENNILGSLNVFDAVRELKKDAVYIAVGNHWMNNPYSISKTTAERFALMYNAEMGTRIAVVRGMNVYGPGQKAAPVRKIMPNFVLPALAGDEITIYGDGTQIMDMIYADDMADVLVRALLEPHGVYDRVFEAGTGEDITVNQIAKLVIKHAGGGRVKHVEMRPGEIPNSVVKADPSTLIPLGLPRADRFTPIDIGIARTVEWYRGA